MSAARGGLEPLVLPFLAPRLFRQQQQRHRTAPSSLVASSTCSSPAAVPRTRATRRTASTQAQLKQPPPRAAGVDWTRDSSRWERFGPLQHEPVASTSAVRLDAAPSPAPSASASPPPPLCLSDDSLSNQQAIDALVAELEPALERLRAAYLASPSSSTSSPLQLVRSTLSAAAALEHVATATHDHHHHHHHHQKTPPIPPPLIRLDPQPHAGPNSRLWTPFLLQALFLGASALGLLARRKVNQHVGGGSGDGGGLATERRGGGGMRKAQRARQEAEDRIDQVQALNLLVVALGQPDPWTVSLSSTAGKEHAPTPAPRERWHDELAAAKNLAGLLHRVERDRLPFDHFTVLAALRVVATAGLRDGSVEHRRAIGLWAWRAAQPTEDAASKPRPDLSSADDAGKAAITRAFLSLLYPSFEASRRHFFPRSTSSPLTDRHILNSLSERILPTPTPGTSRPDPNPVLVRELAETAWRARRVDILGRIAIAATQDEVYASVRLLATSRALKVLAMDAQRRRKAEIVLPWAAAFVDSVKAAVAVAVDDSDRRLLPADLESVRAGLSCLTRDRAFAINRPLAPFIAETCLALLRNPIIATLLLFADADKKSANLVERSMRYLVRSRHPRLAEEVFAAIPQDLVSLQHYRILLSSDHAPLSTRTWTSLIDHPTLQPDAATVRAALVPVAQSPDRTALSRAFRLFRRLEKPTSRDWNLLLSVASRHGSDRLLNRVRREMAASGVGADRYAAAALVSRDMTKTDKQKRTVLDQHALASDSDSLRATRRAVEQLRRVSGTAQIRRVRLAAREWDQVAAARKPSSVLSRRPNEQAEDILPNLLLKNAARWPKEYGVKKLVLLAKAQLGVDLQAGAAPTTDNDNVNLHEARNVPPAVPTWRHFEQVRRPAFRTLAKALEKRGRADLAAKLRKLMREEEARVQRQERRTRRESAVHL
ncbi:hypothetical protein C6P46_006530 [Rhodotorula mucilaginosa]|uniref:Uncharacterized protein n=1 Tax=Rhodotorula mucilaginosa TaxID=5537 RepID=A0A9P6VW50_RHOMI|nr:hypothetical protein C6P46_006530 [Rhodotorula mucilaginosa]